MSVGAVVLGVLNGLTIGLLAVGFVLVYKSNRFLNLAHAQLGTLSAVLVAKWVIDWGWNWWLAYVLAIEEADESVRHSVLRHRSIRLSADRLADAGH